ncbi:hypothetical protein CAN33_000355 [Aspergillus niger]|uniref:Zn(2)-C6 fungal-type domain-containing protein n=1 Tax=Aspergillus niger TaxID=5061 RepID=A0A505I1I7_ASPNG|nr:hypothetical protein CAN33_000355 [Aspergillus niger]
MSRPQVSIDRLTPRRVHAEPRESMNCKSCRKRKIKCNRLRPSCEACKVFQCPCIYGLVPLVCHSNPELLLILLDAVPKKRGPKTDVLEALLKRVDGLEKRLQEDSPISPTSATSPVKSMDQQLLPSASTPFQYTTPNPPQGSLEYARQARRLVDIDNPSIEGTQSLLLLCHTFFAYGCGKTAYMVLANAVSMTLALDLYREAPAALPAAEREMRRRLFWTVYVMDRFLTCGSKRPCLIADHSIVLRLPGSGSETGEWFNPVGPNIHYSPDRRKGPGGPALLVDITRILGVTHRYLAAGGVKGDSHFPWHALSNLSKIRQELDLWAAGTQDLFASIETLFGHPESTLLLLSKLIYHLVHCLLYRPFLPIDLVELRGTGQHQSWQIEATTLCFSHANAIAELVELARHAPRIEWPALVAYCVCTAGTVHVHGVHYHGREGEVFASSADFLAREMHQLSWLRQYWAGVQHQREMLQSISACHAELVRTMAARPVRFAPVFHLEDFLDRYPGLAVDGAHLRLVDGDEPLPLDRPDFNRLMYPPASTLPSQGRGSISFQPSPTWPQPELALPESSLGFSPGVSNSPAPFLSDPFTAPTPPAQPHLLEQLAENEHSQGGPSELDFFLGEGLDMVMPEVEVENP